MTSPAAPSDCPGVADEVPDALLWREVSEALQARFGMDEATGNTAAWTALAAAGRVLAERVEKEVADLRAAQGTNRPTDVSYRVGLTTAAGFIRSWCGLPPEGAAEGGSDAAE